MTGAAGVAVRWRLPTNYNQLTASRARRDCGRQLRFSVRQEHALAQRLGGARRVV